MRSPHENVELPMLATAATGERHMPFDLYLEHHAARSYCLRCLKWQAPALFTVRETGTIPTVATVGICALYTVVEYNAYSTLHWVVHAQAVIYVRNRPWGGGNTLVIVHRDWLYTVSEVLCGASLTSRNTTPPLFLSCNAKRLRIEGLSRFFFLPWSGSIITQVLTPQYAIICTVKGIAGHTGRNIEGRGVGTWRYTPTHHPHAPPTLVTYADAVRLISIDE